MADLFKPRTQLIGNFTRRKTVTPPKIQIASYLAVRTWVCDKALEIQGQANS